MSHFALVSYLMREDAEQGYCTLPQLFAPNSLRCGGCLTVAVRAVGNLTNADEIVAALIERCGERFDDGIKDARVVRVLIRLPRRLTVASDRTIEAVVESLGGSCK